MRWSIVVAAGVLMQACASQGGENIEMRGAADLGFWGPPDAILAEEQNPDAPVHDMRAECEGEPACELAFVTAESSAFARDEAVRVPIRVVYVSPERNPATPEHVGGWVAMLNQKYAGTGFSFYVADSVAVVRPPDDASLPDENCWVQCPADGMKTWSTRLARSHPEVQARNRLMLYLLPHIQRYAGVGVIPGGPSDQISSPMIRGVYLDVPSVMQDAVGVIPHEVGHFFGLHHTFRGGCSRSGSSGQTYPDDLVDDTPRHTNGSYNQFEYACDPLTDTCLQDLGVDPIYNVMSYSSCPNQTFTTGQSQRMQRIWNKYYRRHFLR